MVQLSERVREVLQVSNVSVGETEVINDQTERDITCLVTENARGLGLNIVVGMELCDEAKLAEEGGGTKAIHAFTDFTIHK